MEKFKKSIPYLLILLLVAWFSWKYFVEMKTAPEAKMTLDWDELDSTSGSKPETVPASIKTSPEAKHTGSTKEFSTLTKDEEEKFDVFDRIEKKWLGQVEGIIGEKNFKRYLEMREVNEKEKMQAYKEYHDYLRKKYGDKFTYNISEDQSIREKEINQKYLKDLLKLIGNDKFQAYIQARDKINEENRRNNREFIQIEF